MRIIKTFDKKNCSIFYSVKEMFFIIENLLKILGAHTKEEIKDRDVLRKLGCLVWNQKMREVGQVNIVSLKTVRIKYDNGTEINYDMHKCLSSGTIKLLS